MLEGLIVAGHVDHAVEEVKKIFSDNKNRYQKSKCDLVQLCQVCANSVAEAIWRNGCSLAEERERIRSGLTNMENYFDAETLERDIVLVIEAIGEANARERDGDELIHDLERYLERNYDIDISLGEVARTRYKVSAEHLNRRFKKVFGKNISTYLQSLRMEKAKKYLESTSLNITEIAGMTGYNDISHFIQTFKRSYKETPGEFRRRAGGCEHDRGDKKTADTG
jgi:AraC-like DNA-binding protein